MYELMVTRTFVAQHFLIVPDCGPENEWHSHRYAVELRLQAPELDANGYLVDIDDVKRALDALLSRYKDATLNELPEFEGLNPSIEHFARLFCDGVASRIDTAALHTLEVRIWEDEEAWASYRRDVR